MKSRFTAEKLQAPRRFGKPPGLRSRHLTISRWNLLPFCWIAARPRPSPWHEAAERHASTGRRESAPCRREVRPSPHRNGRSLEACEKGWPDSGNQAPSRCTDGERNLYSPLADRRCAQGSGGSIGLAQRAARGLASFDSRARDILSTLPALPRRGAGVSRACDGRQEPSGCSGPHGRA